MGYYWFDDCECIMKDLEINYLFYSGQYHIPYEKWIWVKIYKQNKLILDLTKWYQVSNYGRIRSVDRIIMNSIGTQRFYKGQFLKPNYLRSKSQRKYRSSCHLAVSINKNKRFFCMPIHKMVKESFEGPTPHGYEISHDDSNPHNNFICNLIFRTPKEHKRHDKIGLSNSGENHPSVCFNDKVVNNIKNLYFSGTITNQAELARRFNIPHKTINNWILGKSRKGYKYNES